MTSVERRKLTEPLASVNRFFGLFMLTLLVLAAVLAGLGMGGASVGGFGAASICVNQPRTTYSVSQQPYPPVAARSGATINFNGTLQACAQHPSVGDRFLYTLTDVSSFVWLGVFFLLWRVVRAARQSGPFTLRVAGLLRLTGWFIIAGSVATASVQGFATDALLNSMLKAHNDFADAIPMPGPLVIPVIAGAATLTFARITRLGVRMDDDLQGTV
jgi:hypothetical protein